MKTFKIAPSVVSLDTAEEFCGRYYINENDLVITNDFTWNKFFKNQRAGNLIFIQNYGVGEPNDEMVEHICRDIKSEYTRVIAIGGGTVLDVAKLFALRQTSPVTDLFDKNIPAIKEKRLILVPTTCGTGSEITNISILEFKKRHTKFGLADDALYADEAVLVPELMDGIPFSVFAASSVDALIHAFESYLSPKASVFSRTFSIQAAKMILSGYKKIENGAELSPELLRSFLVAADFAGIAFSNAGCAAVHAMSYPLGAEFHIPHGEANYAVFSGVFKTYMKMKPDGAIGLLCRIISKILGCDGADALDELDRLLDSAVLKKKRLGEYGMTREQITEFAASVTENQKRLLSNSYVPLTTEQIAEIYAELY